MPAKQPRKAKRPRTAKIAVVNDDTAFLNLMSELLGQEEGYEVSVCIEGANAYAYVKKTQPDLVILDMMVGLEETGWKTLELLTLDPATSKIPIILCTAASSALQQNAAVLEEHGVLSLAKPFDLDDLLGKVQSVLGQDPSKK